MMLGVFWGVYILLVLSLLMWVVKHPLGIGACVLILYMLGSVVVGFAVSFVVGVFLFLTGVSGIMVAFLYVVALCPNPVFKSVGHDLGYGGVYLRYLFVGCLWPLVFMGVSFWNSFGVEMGSVAESFQWMCDPCIFGGLAELMPFLGLLLFLCIVSVVSLCGQQKQCLGGHGLLGEMGQTKRNYA